MSFIFDFCSFPRPYSVMKGVLPLIISNKMIINSVFQYYESVVTANNVDKLAIEMRLNRLSL